MCGIAGWVDWERDLTEERPTAESMTETMRCRGPDDGGLWLAPRAALGHRRLAVIDIEGGKQPMSHDDDGAPVVLTYSGEVYNFRELRAELQAHGHRFRTRCDTEVVLRTYLRFVVPPLQPPLLTPPRWHPPNRGGKHPRRRGPPPP